MSRIVVKNLPKKITEYKLRQIFGEKGLLTDVQLKYTPDGKFRRFAFLGYQSEDEATDAIKHFNNTCIQTNKIIVEHCTTLGDSAKPKSWSKYATDSSTYKKLHPEKQIDVKNDIKKSSIIAKTIDKKAEILRKYKNDPQFEEYLQMHAPKELELLNNLKAAGDDESSDDDASSDSGVSETEGDFDQDQHKGNESEEPKKEKQKKQKQKKDIQLFTLKLKDLPYKCKKKDIKTFFKPNIPFSIRIPRNIKGIAFVGFKNEKQMKKGLAKDRSILSGKSILVTEYVNPNSKHDDNHDPKKVKWISQEEKLKNEEDIGESGKIFLRNLSYTTTEDDIQNLFSKYGPIAEVNLPIDNVTRKIKGFGTITFLLPEHAVQAYTELDGSILHGRMLHLLPGKAKDNSEKDEKDDNTNYKQQKEKKQKAQSGSSHNWNSLFMGHNAVAEVMAENYGTSKKGVLDPHGNSNVAVRLALGETQIVAETRKYLEGEGVILDAFSGPNIKRSKTIILIKNLPAHTKIIELRNVFEKYGVIGRIILPPMGITAIVEFVEPSEARKAFSSLAYSQFKNVPLFLEWAPEGSLKPINQNAKSKMNNVDSDPVVDKSPDKQKSDLDDNQSNLEIEKDEVLEPEPDTTLFVKNLNFKTTDEEFRKHFESCGKLFSAIITKKKDPNNPGNKLSTGYGFVRFMYKSGVNKALKELQNSTLDGKSLELKRSERTFANEVMTTRKVAKKTKQTGSKLLIRNVPFQAKKEELFELFKTFGEIKALRLPKKMTIGETTHRGFAFVEYFIPSDAKKAFEALSQSTHLYGRRLVLEWATTEEGVEDIRKRTATHFHTEEAPKSKKSVFNID